MDSFYARFFPHEDSNAYASYHRELQALLVEPGRVLDLGCGKNTQLACYRTPRREAWGADFEPHPRLEHAEWFRPLGPGGQIPFPAETFDVVASTWVLEHVASPAQFLSEIVRVLRPGGCFVALTINGLHYVTWITRLLHLLPHRVTQQVVYRLYGRVPHDTFPTHYRLNTPGQLRRAARAAGLELASLTGIANPDYFSFWQPLRRAAIVTDWCLECVGRGLGRVYFVTVLRKPGAGELRTSLPLAA